MKGAEDLFSDTQTHYDTPERDLTGLRVRPRNDEIHGIRYGSGRVRKITSEAHREVCESGERMESGSKSRELLRKPVSEED